MTPTNDGPPGDDRPSFKEAMKRVIAERRKAAGPHPDLDTLSAYAAGELPEPEAERVRDHLALCAACTGTVLDLSILAGRHEVAEVGELSDAEEDEQLAAERMPELEAAWSDLRARLERERVVGGRETPRPPAPPAPPVAPVVEMPRRPERPERVYDTASVRRPWAIAAVLAAACLVLAVKAWRSPSSSADLQPVAMAEVIPAGHSEFQVRGAPDGARLSAKSASVLTLALPSDAADQPAFRVEIRPVAGAGDGKTIENVPARNGRELLILLPAGSLAAGRYEALVSPTGDRILAEPLRYPFEVVP